jgi:hypothetical protein
MDNKMTGEIMEEETMVEEVNNLDDSTNSKSLNGYFVSIRNWL